MSLFNKSKGLFEQMDKEAVQMQKEMQTKMEKKAQDLATGPSFRPRVATHQTNLRPHASPNALKPVLKQSIFPTIKSQTFDQEGAPQANPQPVRAPNTNTPNPVSPSPKPLDTQTKPPTVTKPVTIANHNNNTNNNNNNPQANPNLSRNVTPPAQITTPSFGTKMAPSNSTISSASANNTTNSTQQQPRREPRITMGAARPSPLRNSFKTDNLISKMVTSGMSASLKRYLEENPEQGKLLFFDLAVQNLPPLVLAAKMGDVLGTTELLQFAQKMALDLNQPIFSNNKTIFHEAINLNLPEATLTLLLSFPNLDASATDANGNTVLHLLSSAFCGNDPSQPLTILFQKGAANLVNKKNRQGMTPLHKTATNYSCGVELAKNILAQGADLNAQDQDGHTPLHIACHCSNDEVAALLISKGANVNINSSKHLKPLDIAVVTNNQFLIGLLRPAQTAAPIPTPSPISATAPVSLPKPEIPPSRPVVATSSSNVSNQDNARGEKIDLSKFMLKAIDLSLSGPSSGVLRLPSASESSGSRSVSVALKDIQQQLLQTPGLEASLKIPPHPNLLKYYGLLSGSTKNYLVVKSQPNFLPLGAALDTWRNLFQEKYVLRVLTSVCYALLQLAAINGGHGDLTPDSVFVDENGNAKLTNYGLSKGNNVADLVAFGKIAQQVYACAQKIGAKVSENLLVNVIRECQQAPKAQTAITFNEIAEMLESAYELAVEPLQKQVERQAEQLRDKEREDQEKNEQLQRQQQILESKDEELEEKQNLILQLEQDLQEMQEALSRSNNNNNNNNKNSSESITNTNNNTDLSYANPNLINYNNDDPPPAPEETQLVSNPIILEDELVLYDIQTLIENELQGRLTLQWDDFAQIVYANSCASMEDIARIGYLIADRHGEVQVRQWDHVLLWFPSLYPNDTDMTTLENAWKFAEVVEIVGQEYFWGFLTANQAAELLSTRPSGSFLLRFSSQPGYYALSLACANQFTMHWRIKAFKDHHNNTNLYVDERHYSGFHDLITTHEVEALEIVGSANQEAVCLQYPVHRF